MNFWASKLAASRQQPAVPQYAHPPQPQQYQAWWNDVPTPEPAPQLQQPQPQFSVPQQPRSGHNSMPCPECGSGNYMSVVPEGPSVMMGQARARCFDCGYPYIQAGSRSIGIKGDGTVTASRQIHDGSSQVISGFITHLQ